MIENNKSLLTEWTEQIKKNKETEDKIFNLYDTPNVQTDKLTDKTIYVSIFPESRSTKPEDEYGRITNGLKLQPTMFSLEQLKEQVAVKGKTFCGCIFLDLDYYNSIYGKCTAYERAIENEYAWNLLYQTALGTPKWIMENTVTTFPLNVGGKVTNKESHFILMSTFGLDVDHKQDKNKNDITPEYGKMYEEVRQRIINLDLNVLFAYKTFSDPEKGERFRLIFKLDVPIFSWKLAHGILFLLQAMFPEYFDNNCTNVNRNFHGSNTPIEETHPLFGTNIPLDKFFRIFEQYLKNKDSSNFARNMKQYSIKTGINLLNGIFHIRKVTLTKEQVKQLRAEQENTYNMNMFADYHFCVKGNVCQKVFGNEKLYENAESLYYYIIVIRQFRRK